jgi:NADH-quinone oxidoreductase subunit F
MLTDKIKSCCGSGSSVPILPADLILKTTNGEPRLMSTTSRRWIRYWNDVSSGGFIVADGTSISSTTFTFYPFYISGKPGNAAYAAKAQGDGKDP